MIARAAAGRHCCAGYGKPPVACRPLPDIRPSDLSNTLLFSAASLWELAIKQGRGRDDFQVDPVLLRRRLVDSFYTELPITGSHAVTVGGLPPLHKDPFDRILVAQAMVEGVTLLTADPLVGQYPAPIRLVPATRLPAE